MKKTIAIITIVVLIANILLYAMGKISLRAFWIIVFIAFLISLFYKKNM